MTRRQRWVGVNPRHPGDRASGPPRVVLVTGASSGIGLATARALHDRGDAITLVSRDAAALAHAAAGLPGALVAVADVTDADALRTAIDATIDRFGRLDAVVHAAQTMAYGLIEDVPQEIYERVVSVAMFGTANLARIVLPRFRQQRGGTLVIVNSLLGEIATPRMGAYDSAKWGQLGLARVLQLEVRQTRGVHVCTVSPGAIDTPIYDQAANYAGRAGWPPPPIVPATRVAHAVLDCLDRPRRHVEVGPTNLLTKLGFHVAPAVYDRIVGALVDRFVFRGPHAPDHPGNVLRPQPERETQSAGWTTFGRRRH